MNYELALQLKEAGFPQSCQSLVGFNRDGELIGYDNCCDRWNNGPLHTYVPTLEELIEACGNKFGGILQVTGWAYKWGAYALDDLPFEKKMNFHGDTPIEAVAMLWLALNKNEQAR